MARKGSNIYLRKTGKWEGRYIKGRKENGRLSYGYVSGDTYEETLKRRDEAAMIYETSRKVKNIPDDSGLLFSAISLEWLKAREPFLKESSTAKYRNILNKYLLPQFGSRYVTEIKRDEFSYYLTELLISGGTLGKGLSAKGVRSIIFVLNAVVEYANEFKEVNVAAPGKIPLKDHKKPLRVFSVKEQHKLEDFLLSDMGNDRLGILLCLYTGIRLGELCALKWEDISFENKKLDIHATMTRVQTPDDPKRRTKVIVTLPKSESSVREIPLPSDMLRLMREMKEPEDTYLLTGLPNVYVEPRTMENRFKAIINTCGIADANFHALRHTFATRCIEMGFDAKSLSEILGHASVKITMDRYVHPTMDLKQKNMEKLSKFMSNREQS